MRSALYWFKFGVYLAVAIIMLVFGAFFLRQVYVSLPLARGEVTFSSLLLGSILLMVGGAILCTTLARTIRRAFVHDRLHVR